MNRRNVRTRNVLIFTVVAVLAVAAVVQQLRRPPQERTWYGTIAGVPYDFRIPTVERLRATFWNPNNPNLLVPQPFGIGWSINFYRLMHPETVPGLEVQEEV